MQWLNREPVNLKGNRLFPRRDGGKAGAGGRGGGLWFHRLGQAKLLKRSHTFLVKAVLSPSKWVLCFMSPYSLPREVAEEKTQNEKWKLGARLSETGCLK